MAIPRIDATHFGLTMWPSTAASIPADWTRYTDGDASFLQGAVTSGGTGGSTGTHDHTANAHTHTTSHTHVLSISGDSQTSTTSDLSRFGTTASKHVHTHSDGNTDSASPTYSSPVNTVFPTNTHKQSNFEVIFIKPDDDSQNIPDGAVVFGNRTTVPSGFHLTDGNDGAVNMDDRYLLGAAAASDGGATGGQDTHTHSVLSHSHTQNAHVHDDSSFGSASTTDNLAGGSKFTYTIGVHHTATSIQSVTAVTNASSETTAATSNDPVFTQLLGLENTSGGAVEEFDRLVIPYIGTMGDALPDDWFFCTGGDGTLNLTACQIKVTVTAGSVGGTGGSDAAHTHTGGAGHTHTETAHDHTYVFGTVGSGTAGTGTAVSWSPSSHTHDVNGDDLAEASPTSGSTEVTMDSTTAKWAFREVLFIQANKPVTTVKILGGKILGGKIL